MVDNIEYQQIDLSAWKQVGEGGNGKTYVSEAEPGVILKVNGERLSTEQAVRREFEVSRAVASLGLPVPRMLRMVQVGEAYGTVAELIKGKKSLSRICCDEPERIPEMAKLLCAKGKEMFATPCNTEVFPSRKEQVLRAVDGATFLSRKMRARLRSFAESILESRTCVHGDFQMGNLIVSGEQYYWIDLDRFAWGDPMFDIGHLFMLCNVYSKLKQARGLFHLTEAQLREFWDAFAREYTGQEDHKDFDALAGKFAALDVVIRTLFVKPSFLEKMFFRMHVNGLMKRYY